MARTAVILICYATAGAGHRRAAEAIADAARARWPRAQVHCVDVLDYTPRWFRSAYSWTYLFLVRYAPWIWSVSYTLLDRAAVFGFIRPLRRMWNVAITRRFARWISLQPPDVVVAAHFLPADVCSAGKRAGWLTAPLVVVVTDWHPHRFWVSREADGVVLAAEEGAEVCRRRGLSPERLHVIGIPIAGFARQSGAAGPARDRGALQALFGLSPDRRTVLVTSGGTTVGPFERVVSALMKVEDVLPGQMQLLVVCGENRAAVRRVTRRAQGASMPVAVRGFIDNMIEAMAVSDLLVAKAGGMTLAEALGQGVPLVLYHAIPGQERLNARYVVRQGAAVMARRPADVAQVVRRCMEDAAYLDSLRRAAKTLSRPGSAEAVVSQVIEPLLPTREEHVE